MKRGRNVFLAVVILIAAGFLVRSVSHGEETPIRQSLAAFPLQLAPWSGRQLGLEGQVVQLLQVDDYIVRYYQREQEPPIGLYISYFQSMREGKGYHSPKNCLPGSGWYFADMSITSLDVPGEHGQGVQVKKLIMQKGLEKQLVLYWYQDRGRIITSEYWAKIYMVWDAITKNRTDGAFVRITVPFSQQDEQRALEQGKAFAETIFPLLRQYLPG